MTVTDQEQMAVTPGARPPGASQGIVGIDIGGTKIAGLLVDESGTIVTRVSVAAPASEGGDAMADAAATLVRDLVARASARLVAVGVLSLIHI